MRGIFSQIAYAVQGSGGPIPATWNVGTLNATTVNATTLAGVSGTLNLTTVNTSVPGTTGTEVVNFSQFNPAASANGSTLLPGGLILNWGNAITPGGGSLAVGFNRSYATACFAVVATTLTTSPPSTVSAVVASTSSFNATTFQSNVPQGAVTFYWVAIGL